MSDETENLLMKAAPDSGPARILISMIATIVAVTTTAATGLFGAEKAELAAIILMAGLVLAIAFFCYFRRDILGRTCFSAALPFESELRHAQETRNQMESLRAECEQKIKPIESKTPAVVRANIFRPSDEYQPYGCACILKIDPQLQSGMTELEIASIRFLPGEGHTGKAFMTAKTSCGPPTVAITGEQLAYLSEKLAYIISCPLKWQSCVVGVMNIDFCCRGAKPTEQQKQELTAELEKMKGELLELVETKARRVAGSLAKGKLQRVRLLRGP